jgi:hypothetical protein
MILITVLLLIFLLISVGMGSVVSVQNNYRTSVNLRAGISALYLAESGIEWAKEQIATVVTMPLAITNGGHSLSVGSFTVTFLASTQPSPLTARVTVRSTGTLSDSSQTVQAGISKNYDLADGALVLRGEARGINVANELLLVDGRDRDPVTRVLIEGAKPRLGISVAGAALLTQVNRALSDAQAKNIIGGDAGGAAIAQSSWLTSEAIAAMAEGLCTTPAAHTSSIGALENLSMADRILGTRGSPEIHCLDGPIDSGDSAIFTGNITGAGILIVRNAEMVISGTFTWEGLVIVTGRDIGVSVSGAASKEIVGALLVNETGSVLGNGPAMAAVQGNIRLLYSRLALGLAATLIPNATMQSSYAALPFMIKQDYWRSIAP